MTRLEANKEILEYISQAIELNPGLRFHQILQNLAIENPHKDQFYEESEKTLHDIEESLTPYDRRDEDLIML